MTSTPKAPVRSAPAIDLHAIMLEVVADKTGYPAEMLQLEMDLEGDLGIDSIKRVEILSAVQEQAPGMPDVDAAHMGTLKTLGEIVHYMQSLLGAAAPAAPTQTQSQKAPAIDQHLRQLGELGLLGITVPAEHGGAGMDTLAAVIAHEELSKSDP